MGVIDLAGTRTVTLYKAAAKTPGDIVAQGSLTGDGTITLTQQLGSGLSGSVDVAWTANDTDIGNTLVLSLRDDINAGNTLVKLGASITESGDDFNQLSNWQLLVPSAITPVLGTVNLYMSSAKGAGNLVAAGSLPVDGTITLAEQNGSGMSGTVDVTYKTAIIESGDTLNQLSNWQLTGKSTGSYSFVLYWELTDSHAVRTVKLYRSAAKLPSDLVAQGSLLGDGTIALTQQLGSGISGTVDVLFQRNDTAVYDPITQTYNTLEVTFRDIDAGNTLAISFNDTDTGNVIATPNFSVLYWNGNTATATHKTGDIVIMTALPSPGSIFTGWSGGGCTGTGTCTVTMDVAKSVTATFTRPDPPTLTVNRAGSGSGSVTPDTGSLIFIGNTAATTYPYSTTVILTAVPNVGSIFTGWSGECRNTGPTCVVLMSGNLNTTAHFLMANTSSYADVPSGNPVSPYTESLSNNNIATGCTSGSFCPSTMINNGQMAVLIVKALGLLPAAACTGTMFSDVNSSMAGGAEACSYVEKFGELNILPARGDGYFLPDATVSRALIAEVIVRALGMTPATSCTSAVFDDVNDAMFGGTTSCRYMRSSRSSVPLPDAAMIIIVLTAR